MNRIYLNQVVVISGRQSPFRCEPLKFHSKLLNFQVLGIIKKKKMLTAGVEVVVGAGVVAGVDGVVAGVVGDVAGVVGVVAGVVGVVTGVVDGVVGCLHTTKTESKN